MAIVNKDTAPSQHQQKYSTEMPFSPAEYKPVSYLLGYTDKGMDDGLTTWEVGTGYTPTGNK